MRSAKTVRLSSLGLKVLIAYVIGALVSIALAVVAAVWIVQHDVLAGLELVERTSHLTQKIKFDTQGKPIGIETSAADLDWLYDSLQHEAAYRVLDAAGNVILHSKAEDAFWPPQDSSPRLGQGGFAFERNGVTIHGATEPFVHQGQQWYVQYATSARLMKLIQHKFALPYLGIGMGIFSALLIVAFGLCAYVTLRYALKPLRGISQAAAAISPRSLHARLETEAIPIEISPLVDSFNRTLERLEHGYRLQQTFLANAAHELKTPLALIRAQIELGEHNADARRALLLDVEYMSRQVQQLLHLTEASEPNNYRLSAVSVPEVVHETVDFLLRMAQAAEVNLNIREHAHDVRWQADRGALFTMLKNLCENAIQHAPQKTDICVEILSDEITIRDYGLGVDAEQLPLLFTRFWRGAHRKDQGAGLGLAICQEVALAHGWVLLVELAKPGLRFRILNGENLTSAPFAPFAPAIRVP